MNDPAPLRAGSFMSATVIWPRFALRLPGCALAERRVCPGRWNGRAQAHLGFGGLDDKNGTSAWALAWHCGGGGLKAPTPTVPCCSHFFAQVERASSLPVSNRRRSRVDRPGNCTHSVPDRWARLGRRSSHDEGRRGLWRPRRRRGTCAWPRRKWMGEGGLEAPFPHPLFQNFGGKVRRRSAMAGVDVMVSPAPCGPRNPSGAERPALKAGRLAPWRPST
jgi:hypothetical protein